MLFALMASLLLVSSAVAEETAGRFTHNVILVTLDGVRVQEVFGGLDDITIPGSDDIWLAVVGPDTPDRGEVTEAGMLYQGQVAATLLQFLGLDMRTVDSAALPPVPGTVAADRSPISLND